MQLYLGSFTLASVCATSESSLISAVVTSGSDYSLFVLRSLHSGIRCGRIHPTQNSLIKKRSKNISKDERRAIEHFQEAKLRILNLTIGHFGAVKCDLRKISLVTGGVDL
jgi:hypothetical protein